MGEEDEENEIKEIGSIYNLYIDDLFVYALSLGFDRETCMDAIQDVFCKICANEKLLESITHIKFFLFRMLKNRLIDIYKSRKDQVSFSDQSITAFDEMPFNVKVTIEDQLINCEEEEKIKSTIESMLKNLTNRQREIVYLRYSQGYNYSEIAELLSISVPSCRKLVHKSLSVLREKYPSLESLKLILSLFYC